MNTFKRTLAVFLATSSIALALPLAANAGPMMGGGMEGGCGQGRSAMRGGPDDGLPPMMKKLKLTPAQEAKITELRKQDSELISAKYQSMRDSGAQLDELGADRGLDRGYAKLVGHDPVRGELERAAEAWRPFRAYAAQHLWSLDGVGATQSAQKETR